MLAYLTAERCTVNTSSKSVARTARTETLRHELTEGTTK